MLITYHYPGDPPELADLMFGKEFKKKRGPGYIKINDDPPTYFDEAVCDLCNSEVTDLDPCALTRTTLYCWPCFLQHLREYVKLSSESTPHPELPFQSTSE